MGNLIEIEKRILVDLSDGGIIIDGEPQPVGLTKQERRALKCIIDSYPRIATFKRINEAAWPDGGEWGADRLNTLKKSISNIKSKCKLEKPIANKNEQGFKLNGKWNIRLIPNASLCTESIQSIDLKPGFFIEPNEWIESLSESAFTSNNVVFVSGEPGIGKTVLVRQFAKKCLSGQISRKDISFKNVIFTSYSGSLRNTIELLPCEGAQTEETPFDLKIRLLNEIEKPALIIMDNYDNETYLDEFSDDYPAFKILRNTGCHILFTTRQDMSGCNFVPQVRLRHFPTTKLLGLLFSIIDAVDQEELLIAPILIEKCLRNNTYLVSLVAHLIQTRSIKEIWDAFTGLHIEDINDPLYGKHGEELSLLEQYIELLNISSILGDEDYARMLYTLSLIPNDGIAYEDFFKYSFDKGEVLKYKLLFKKLNARYLPFLSDRRISIPPLLREALISKKIFFSHEYVNYFISSINKEIEVDCFTSDLLARIKIAVSACDLVDKIKTDFWGIAILNANLSSIMDMIGSKDATLKYGICAIEYLERCAGMEGCNEYEVARAYNIAGYALLHTKGNEEVLSCAEKALFRAQSIISAIIKEENCIPELYYTNIGNIAALNIKKGDYEYALELHKQNLLARKKILKKAPSAQVRRRLAASCKGMATCFYYLSKKNKYSRKEMLTESYVYHCKAVDSYKEAHKQSYNIEIAVAENRRVGTVCELVSLLGRQDAVKLIKKSIKEMRSAIE